MTGRALRNLVGDTVMVVWRRANHADLVIVLSVQEAQAATRIRTA